MPVRHIASLAGYLEAQLAIVPRFGLLKALGLSRNQMTALSRRFRQDSRLIGIVGQVLFLHDNFGTEACELGCVESDGTTRRGSQRARLPAFSDAAIVARSSTNELPCLETVAGAALLKLIITDAV